MSDINRTALVTDNFGLVHICANRFKGRGVEYEDLFQAGCVGLIKAAAGFDPKRGFKFSTYAVPAVLGEIRRIFRDGGSVKIGRAAKEKARRLLAIKNALELEGCKEPAISEIAEKAGMDISQAAVLICACMPVVSLTSDGGEAQTDIPVPSPDEKLYERIDLDAAIDKLGADEKNIINLRYFKGLTQSKTAEKLGMTQVQVSRREKNILLKLKKLLS